MEDSFRRPVPKAKFLDGVNLIKLRVTPGGRKSKFNKIKVIKE